MTDASGHMPLSLSRRVFIGSTVAAVGVVAVGCSPDVDDAGEKESPARLVPPEQLFDPLQPPTQFQVSLRDNGSVRASWIGGCVGEGKPRYRVYVDGAVAASTGSLNATLTNLTAGEHAIAVATADSTGAQSSRTPESIIAVGSDAAGPPLILEAVPGSSSIQFRWTMGRGYAGPTVNSYRLRRADLPRPIAVTTKDDSAADRWFFATNVTPDQPRDYYVEAFDANEKSLGRSVNSVRVAPYKRGWPSSYETPNPPSSIGSVVDGGDAVTTWSNSDDVLDVNVFVDGVFVSQLSSPVTEFRSPAGVERRVALRSVSRWGVVSDEESVTAPVVPSSRKSFTTRGGLILDPDGLPFLPIGTNISGLDFFWNERVFGTAAAARDRWRMTAVRLDCGLRDWGAVSGAQGNLFFTNNDLDRVVKEYTDAGIVVIIAQFNKGITSTSEPNSTGLLAVSPGSAPDGSGRSVEDATTDWWIEVARRHRNNPRVWFNPINEPREDLDGLHAQYSRMLDRIRAVAPLSPLVLDAANFANDIPTDSDIGGGPIRQADSFVLTHGRDLFEKYGEPKGFGPVIYSIHAYSRWPRNYATNELLPDPAIADRMRTYVRDVRALGLPLLVGETGVEDFAPQSDSATVRVGLYEQGRSNGVTTGVWPEQQVGVIAWHASPVSGMPLSTGAWQSVDDVVDTAPPPDAGRGIWNYGHLIRP